MIQCRSIGTGAAEVIVQAQSEQAMKSTQKRAWDDGYKIGGLWGFGVC